jgi:hypothetical protein
MQKLSRRAMLCGSSVAAVVLAVPGVASAAVSDDAELLRLEAELAANEVEYDKADDERVEANKAGLPDDHLWAAMDRIGDRGGAIQDAIIATPARSGIGIAVKLRLALRLGGNLEENYDHQDLITLSALRDAERLAGKGGAASAVALPVVPVASKSQ